MKPVIEALSEVGETVRGEYAPGNDGKFYLKLDSAPAGFVPAARAEELKGTVTEFRTTNIGLMKERDALLEKMKGFEGIDPEEYKQLKQLGSKGVRNPSDLDAAIQAAIKPLAEKLSAAEKREEDAQKKVQFGTLERSISAAGLKLGVIEGAITDFINRGLETFDLDGVARDDEGQTVYSKVNPGKPLTIDEWAAGLQVEAAHLFKSSKGGGNPANNHSNRGGEGIKAGARVLLNPSQKDLGALKFVPGKGLVDTTGTPVQIVNQ